MLHISNLPNDLLINIFINCCPKSLRKCESVCEDWRNLINSSDSTIWKCKLYQVIAKYNHLGDSKENAISFLDKIKLIKGETWKKAFRIWSVWNREDWLFDMSQIGDPVLVPSLDIHRAFRLSSNTKKRVKLGRLIFGDLAFPFDSDEDVWFSNNRNMTYVMDLKKRNLSASLLSLSDVDPKISNISLVKQARSDLLLVQEISKKQINVRAWNPKKYMKERLPSKEPLLWVMPLQNNGKVLGFCGRNLLVIYSNRILVMYQLLNPSLSYFENKSATTCYLWKKELFREDECNLYEDIAFNEVAIAILQHSSKNFDSKTILLLDANSGQNLSSLQFHMPYEMGFERVGVRVTLTRFHLVVYNCCNCIIFDIFFSFNIQPLPPRLVKIFKLPYVGREVRLDASDDGSLFILAPVVQTGEVVLFNMLKNEYNTYLLQNAYAGNQPKLGCWFVYEDDKVEWLPIIIPEVY